MNTAVQEQTTGSPSVVTAFAILDALAEAGRPLTMAEVVRSVGLPKTSAFRLLRALETVGAVTRREDLRYALGTRLGGYGAAAPEPDLVSRFLEIATPAARTLNETMQLGILTGENVTFISFINSTQPVRLVSFVGRSLPAHSSATGKAILAFLPADDLELHLPDELAALTENTITSRDRLRHELEDVRQRGYALESEESTANLSCVAAPVMRTGRVAAAVTICVPRAQIAEEKLRQLSRAAVETASQLSTRAG